MATLSRTFSDLWYRVAEFRPRLSPHLTVKRQTHRGETWFVVGDPSSSKFYRFNAAAYRFLGLLDGRRTVQEAWDVCLAQLGDEAPTQQDCIDLMAQLQQFGLLRNDLPIDVYRLREKLDELHEQKVQQYTGNWVFYTLPLLNPEKFLEKYAHVWRLIFSRWGAIALAVMVILGVRAILPRIDELGTGLNNVIAPSNLIWLSLAFLGLKVIHEGAHAASCKAFGGRCTEIGIMLMIVLPIPYCDASASWAFPSKWKRITVAAAGMLAEVGAASIAAIVWARTDPGTVHTVAYNVMFAASLATVLFNLNPLLRYDGYYILSDLLEIPNLSSRSHELLKWMARRYLFGLKGEPPPPLHSVGEGAAMVLHAVCAFPYRLLVMFAIVLVVSQMYFLLGLGLAIFGGIVWFLVPIVKGLSYVIAEPSLQVVRPRAVGVTFGLIALGVVLIGVVPAPNRAYATGVVESRQQFTYRAPTDGFVRTVAVRNGQQVEPGDLLLTMDNDVLRREMAAAETRLRVEIIRMDAAGSQGFVERKYAREILEAERAEYESLSEAVEEMTLTAPFAGRVVAPEIETREGSFVRRGDPILTLATPDDLVVRAYLDDADFAWVLGVGEDGVPAAGPLRSVAARLQGQAGNVIELDVSRIPEGGVRSIRYRSLAATAEGGSIAVDPTDSSGRRTINPQWEVTLEFEPGQMPTVLPGTRAKVCFSMERVPLAQQWYRKIRQALGRHLTE